MAHWSLLLPGGEGGVVAADAMLLRAERLPQVPRNPKGFHLEEESGFH